MGRSPDPPGTQSADAEQNSVASIPEDADGGDAEDVKDGGGEATTFLSPCLLFDLTTFTDCLILILRKEVPRAIWSGRGASKGTSAAALRSKRRVEKGEEGGGEEEAASSTAAGAPSSPSGAATGANGSHTANSFFAVSL